ncbi:hypothetical protein EJ05DRAFT_150266 [Pseudovirgaria hyperparasitica]|uniref:Uncharacterized protein n=1 Tax=Pseudovirgaria hyperparasitica TaxID=470096 RepID=A0A6A6VWH6_9PEZI|nr:uncharacterized protein EJ05DRAFT_150266 [Pseudovirgaria hyperparasitica]KAF2754146.1 hypothetical protein EJ05DRAFT_150266 [Pseudovirgaria hyperparasitica]
MINASIENIQLQSEHERDADEVLRRHGKLTDGRRRNTDLTVLLVGASTVNPPYVHAARVVDGPRCYINTYMSDNWCVHRIPRHDKFAPLTGLTVRETRNRMVTCCPRTMVGLVCGTDAILCDHPFRTANMHSLYSLRGINANTRTPVRSRAAEQCGKLSAYWTMEIPVNTADHHCTVNELASNGSGYRYGCKGLSFAL